MKSSFQPLFANANAKRKKKSHNKCIGAHLSNLRYSRKICWPIRTRVKQPRACHCTIHPLIKVNSVGAAYVSLCCSILWHLLIFTIAAKKEISKKKETKKTQKKQPKTTITKPEGGQFALEGFRGLSRSFHRISGCCEHSGHRPYLVAPVGSYPAGGRVRWETETLPAPVWPWRNSFLCPLCKTHSALTLENVWSAFPKIIIEK